MKEQMYRAIYRAQKNHWWYKVRKYIVLDQIERFYRPDREAKVIDVGCGCGFLLKALRKYGSVFAVENTDIVTHILKRHKDVRIEYCDFPRLRPFPQEDFSLITCLDVLEHIEDDEAALAQLYTMLKPDGCMVLTVPAHMFLWSKHDEDNLHFRRYGKKELLEKVKRAGFHIKRLSYFNSILFPPIVLYRLLSRLCETRSTDLEASRNPLIDKLLFKLFSMERRILHRRNLPMGVSLLLVATKPT